MTHAAGDMPRRAPGDSAGIGRALIAAGLVTPHELSLAEAEAAQTEQSLARVLVARGAVSESDIAVAAATHLGHRYVDLAEYPVDLEAVALLTEPMARRYQALPIDFNDSRLVVAMADPTDLFAVDDIKILTNAEIERFVTTPQSLERAFAKYFRLDSETAELGRRSEADDESLPADDAPIVRLAHVLIAQAIADRASDVHLEPRAEDLRVRYRVDGVLHEMKRLPKAIQPALVSRLKIMAELDISERRVPQDGRITSVIAGRSADVRVSVLPTVHGEQVTLRILDKSNAVLSLDELGFLPDVAARYESVFHRPYGTILVTGPTGSGKTTTLYATLHALNTESRKIVTIEDPVEYQLAGIAQMQVNPKAGLTFARALRSILRSDPDVVLVGEIRDHETAQTTIDAALTGHLVVSSLHTNTAAHAPSRLIEMGVEPYLIGSALDAVVAQRLARCLCEKCRQPVEPSDSEREALAEVGAADVACVMRPVGCAACANTGYAGRVGLHEVLIVTEEIERLIARRALSDEIREVAVDQGMQLLRTVGLRQVVAGQTSVEEVLRVVV